MAQSGTIHYITLAQGGPYAEVIVVYGSLQRNDPPISVFVTNIPEEHLTKFQIWKSSIVSKVKSWTSAFMFHS